MAGIANGVKRRSVKGYVGCIRGSFRKNESIVAPPKSRAVSTRRPPRESSAAPPAAKSSSTKGVR